MFINAAALLKSIEIFAFIALIQLRIRPKVGMMSWPQAWTILDILWLPIFILVAGTSSWIILAITKVCEP